MAAPDEVLVLHHDQPTNSNSDETQTLEAVCKPITPSFHVPMVRSFFQCSQNKKSWPPTSSFELFQQTTQANPPFDVLHDLESWHLSRGLGIYPGTGPPFANRSWHLPGDRSARHEPFHICYSSLSPTNATGEVFYTMQH